jgi:hypothetical protein
LAFRDLADLWRTAGTPEQVAAALRDVLPALIDTYGLAAATLAADWYDDVRDSREVRGHFTAIPAEVPETGTQALVGWALSEAQDLPGFQTLILGGAQRRIANFSRLTVMGSSIADPAARGWERVGSGSSCEFCQMLLGRGAVYTEASADFEAHDHDDCGAAPAWR